MRESLATGSLPGRIYTASLTSLRGRNQTLGGAQRETLRCQEWGWEVSHLSDFGCCPHCPAEGGFLRRNNLIAPKRASSGVQGSIYLPWQWEEGSCLR